MNKFMEILEREDSCLSLGRIICLLIFLVWMIATFATLFFKFNYAHYDMLTYAMLVGVIQVAFGKWVDFKNPKLPKVGDM